METEAYNLLTIWIYSISAIIALMMVGVAIFQLTRLTSQVEQAVESNKINQFNALLALEQQIAERRITLTKVALLLANEKDSHEEETKINKLKYDEAGQMYLNALDRLCYCATKGILDDNEMRIEYRDTIRQAIHDFKKDFSIGTQYRNITKTHDRWADK